MFKTKPVRDILSQVTTGDVTAALLFNENGRILAHSGQVQVENLTSIANAIWRTYSNYCKTVVNEIPMNEIQIECENGSAIIRRISDYLLCLYSTTPDVNMGLIELKVETLAKHLEEQLAQLEL